MADELEDRVKRLEIADAIHAERYGHILESLGAINGKLDAGNGYQVRMKVLEAANAEMNPEGKPRLMERVRVLERFKATQIYIYSAVGIMALIAALKQGFEWLTHYGQLPISKP